MQVLEEKAAQQEVQTGFWYRRRRAPCLSPASWSPSGNPLFLATVREGHDPRERTRLLQQGRTCTEIILRKKLTLNAFLKGKSVSVC